MSDRAEQLSRLPPAALAIYAAELEELVDELSKATTNADLYVLRSDACALLAKHGRTGK